jgi:ATP-binding cassette subfamily B protein
MEENISGARVVQAFRRQEAVIAEFDRANVATRDATIRAQSLMMILRPLLMVFSNVDIAIIAGLGGWLALQGLVSVGVIATFILYARRFFEPLFTLADLYNSIQAALAGAERVFDILDQRPAVRDRADAVALDRFEGRVAFDHVSFAYEPDVPVLKDVSLSLEPGQVVALVGPTGAGKTTIVNLLTRFYDLDEGHIWIDGHEIRDLEQDSLRRQLGIVLQDNFLFSATALENIRYGRLEASDEECIAAARLANADQFIRRLPEGYQTRLSERASNLSQGQRQLLAIARAFLVDPRILILDEATSSVDTRTESHLQEALRTLMAGRTSFVIAHRLSTIRNADLVLVIDHGRIIEQGTHDSLMAQRGFYYRLYMSQFAPDPKGLQDL